MFRAVRALTAKANGIPEKTILWINVGMASFVALAHGGALALTYAQPTSDSEKIREIAMFSLPVASVVILTATAALVRAPLRPRVLSIHGIVLVGSAASILLWSLGILLGGIPEGKFSWSVGMLSAWVSYSVLVLCRFSLPPALRARNAIIYAPAIALVLAAAVDVGVFVRLLNRMGGLLAN